MGQTFSDFQLLKENDVIIDVSYYPEVDRNQVVGILESENMKYRISPVPVNEFTKNRNLKGNSNIEQAYEKCDFKKCHFLYEGKIAVCAFPLLVKYFNQYFHENIDVSGSIDLYDSRLKKGMLRDLFSKPIDACRYCAVEKEPILWEGHCLEASRSDWCVLQR